MNSHECENGWLDPDGALPCLVCKPHLAPPSRTSRPAPEVAEAGAAAVRAVLEARPGRRRLAADKRASLQAARNAGLRRRHDAKLEHLRAQTLTVPAEALAEALSAARCSTCGQPAVVEMRLDVAARLTWRAAATHADTCTRETP